MTAGTTERRGVRPVLTRQYSRLTRQYSRFRKARASSVLRRLCIMMLLSVAATAGFYLWVVFQASRDIADVNRTQQSISDITNASSAVTDAQRALTRVSQREAVTLVGTGSEFVNQVSVVDKDLTLAAERNAAGAEGTAAIQYVQNQMTSYLLLSDTAVQDYTLGGPLGTAGISYAGSSESNVQSAITTLEHAEETAQNAQRHAWVLDPGTFWWVLPAPVIGMLLLIVATEQVLARHFRRHVSPWLWGSLLTVTAATVVTGFLNTRGATIAIVFLLLLAAGVLAYLAYRPRLAEYRFQP